MVRNLNKKGYWRTWSNGYRGDVYFAPPPSTTITLPAKTTAFYFYVEPNDPGTFSVTATASGTSSGAVKVRGAGGATFFGFVAKGGAHLTTIKVSSSDRSRARSTPAASPSASSGSTRAEAPAAEPGAEAPAAGRRRRAAGAGRRSNARAAHHTGPGAAVGQPSRIRRVEIKAWVMRGSGPSLSDCRRRGPIRIP